MTEEHCLSGECEEDRWRPYSGKYCPRHFVEVVSAAGQRSWVRSRFCGVLNGYTPDTGDVKWDTHWPREELVELAEELGIRLDAVKEVQWRNAQAVVASRNSYRWEKAKHRESSYEGPGARNTIPTLEHIRKQTRSN